MEIELKARAGTAEEKRMARRVQPLIVNINKLSVTLTLMTCISNEALPIFLDRLLPSAASIALAVIFVLTVGEVRHDGVHVAQCDFQIYVTYHTALIPPQVIPAALMKKSDLRLRFTSRFAGKGILAESGVPATYNGFTYPNLQVY